MKTQGTMVQASSAVSYLPVRAALICVRCSVLCVRVLVAYMLVVIAEVPYSLKMKIRHLYINCRYSRPGVLLPGVRAHTAYPAKRNLHCPGESAPMTFTICVQHG